MSGEPGSLASASLWIVDLDGVVWLAGEAIGDAAGAVATLRARGRRVVFATNNSAPTTDQLLERLAAVGITAAAEDLATSAVAAASLLEPGQSAAVLAEGGVLEALAARGVSVGDDRVDAAIVGWSHLFDFESLAATARAARESGRLIGTNEDPTHPTPQGLAPGSGALLAAVRTAAGVSPEIAGKPHTPMADLMKERFGFSEREPSVVLVGDQPRTDGRLAERLGIPFALVDSGVTPAGDDHPGVPVAARASDLAALVEALGPG